MDITPKVIFRLVAHNSEKTIARAIESVICQTYKNIELHVCIRGSTDNTTGIAGTYAEKDDRVRIIINKQNFEYDEGNDIKDFYTDYDVDNDYVCFMDGDDEYKPDFLENMVPFAIENNLDIAACGFDIVDVETGEVADTQKSEDVLIIEGEKFDTMLNAYYRSMRTRWAKIFRISLIGKLDRGRIFFVYYCDDTIETTEYFRVAGRVGLFPQAYYKWYRSSGSLSFRWDKSRIEADRKVQDVVTQYLIDKTGRISAENKDYLMGVYYAAITSTARVVMNARIPEADKFDALYDMFSNSHTRELADSQFKFKEFREKFFSDAITWIVANPQLRDESYFDRICEIMSVIKVMPQSFPGWSETEIIGLLTCFSEKYGV